MHNVHAGSSPGPGCPLSFSCTASVSHSKALVPWRRVVSMTVSKRSTKRLPLADWVPKLSFRQMTA